MLSKQKIPHSKDHSRPKVDRVKTGFKFLSHGPKPIETHYEMRIEYKINNIV